MIMEQGKMVPTNSFTFQMIEWTRDNPTEELSSKRKAEILDDRTARVKNSKLRRTPPSQLTVGQLVFPGDVIEMSYFQRSNDGGKVIRIWEYPCYGLPVFAVLYVPLDAEPLKSGEYGQNDYGCLSEMVAQDGRILKLFEANTDEMFLTGKSQGQSNLEKFFTESNR